MTDRPRNAWATVNLDASFMGPTDDVATPGACLELSRSQLFVGTAEPAPTGQVVRFEIGSASDLGTIRGAAKVVWTSEGEGAEAPRGMALRVLRLDPGCVQNLEMYLASAPLGDTGTRPLLPRSEPPLEGLEREPSAPPSSRPSRARKKRGARSASSRTAVGVYSMRPEAEEPSARRPSDSDHAATHRLRKRLESVGAVEPEATAEPGLLVRESPVAEPPDPALPVIPPAAALPVEWRGLTPPSETATASETAHAAETATASEAAHAAETASAAETAVRDTAVRDTAAARRPPGMLLDSMPMDSGLDGGPVAERATPRGPLARALAWLDGTPLPDARELPPSALLQLRPWLVVVALLALLAVGGYHGLRSDDAPLSGAGTPPAIAPAVPAALPPPFLPPSPPSPPPPLPPLRAPAPEAVVPAPVAPAPTPAPLPEPVNTAAAPGTPTAVTRPRQGAAQPAKQRVPPIAVSEATPSVGASRLEGAIACLSRGDNACVISTLAGKAHSPRELEVLIETYRSIGQTEAARTTAEQLLKLHPATREAQRYARIYKLPLTE
jgi:hypothetical protein